MPLPQLTVYRHGRRKRALITLAGETDLESAPLVRASLERCLRDGIRTIDVDLTAVGFCDCSGLGAFLHGAPSGRLTAPPRPHQRTSMAGSGRMAPRGAIWEPTRSPSPFEATRDHDSPTL